MMRGKKRSRGEGAIGAVIAIGLLILAVIAALKIVPLHIKGNEVFDAMNEAANFGNLKPDEKLRWEIHRRAQEANVPLPLEEIRITKNGRIKISAKYEQTVDVFGYKYKYVFDKSVEKPIF